MEDRVDVHKLRLALDLTQADFAKLCGVTVRTVQNWEIGNVKIPEMTMKTLRGMRDEVIARNDSLVLPSPNMTKTTVNTTELLAILHAKDAQLEKTLIEISKMREIIERKDSIIAQKDELITKFIETTSPKE